MSATPITLIYDNFADAGTLSGGSWAPSLPLANLKTPYMAEVARSSNVTLASTKLAANLGEVQLVGGLALGPANVQPTALWRIRASATSSFAGALLYDTGWIGIPGAVLDSLSMEWEEVGYWEGVPEEFDDLFKSITMIHVLPDTIEAQYWQIEIDDQTNAAGYIQIGRLMIGRALEPTHNFSYGSNSFGLEDLTDEEESQSGVNFFNERAIRRVFNCAFEYLDEADMVRRIYLLAVRSRRSRQIVVVPFPDEPATYQREAFFGTLSQLPAIARNAFNTINTEFVIKEAL